MNLCRSLGLLDPQHPEALHHYLSRGSNTLSFVGMHTWSKIKDGFLD
jgi:hypothetical protein